ncbi:MAG: hypothetical protein GKR87_13275 [Kiritimatiellae bacterium]|nr:hypothetical protein [Kiritimatiellia bacterium]
MYAWRQGPVLLENRTENERADFFSFMAAPHGDTNSHIDRIYIYFPIASLSNDIEHVQEFIADLHSKGHAVEYLSGPDANGALTETNSNTGMPYNQVVVDQLNAIFAYNIASESHEDFDGVQIDVEPNTMKTPYNFNNLSKRLTYIWPQYLASLFLWQWMVDIHNSNEVDSLRFGVVIPHYYDTSNNAPYDRPNELIQDIVDYVAILAYDIRSTATSLTTAEVVYAESNQLTNSIVAALETVFYPTAKESIPESFFNSLYINSPSHNAFGIGALENEIQDLETTFGINSAYAETAIHFYEKKEIGQEEIGCRFLSALDVTNQSPSCLITYPSGGEFMADINNSLSGLRSRYE